MCKFLTHRSDIMSNTQQERSLSYTGKFLVFYQLWNDVAVGNHLLLGPKPDKHCVFGLMLAVRIGPTEIYL